MDKKMQLLEILRQLALDLIADKVTLQWHNVHDEVAIDGSAEGNPVQLTGQQNITIQIMRHVRDG